MVEFRTLQDAAIHRIQSGRLHHHLRHDGTFFFMALYMQDISATALSRPGFRVPADHDRYRGDRADSLGGSPTGSGPRRPMSAGLAVLAVCDVSCFAGINNGPTYAGLVIPFVLMGVGIALVMSPMVDRRG